MLYRLLQHLVTIYERQISKDNVSHAEYNKTYPEKSSLNKVADLTYLLKHYTPTNYQDLFKTFYTASLTNKQVYLSK